MAKLSEMRAAALEVLGVSEEFEALGKADFKAGQEILKRLKRKAVKRFRALSPTYHPDLNGGDSWKSAVYQEMVLVLREIKSKKHARTDRDLVYGLKTPAPTPQRKLLPSSLRKIPNSKQQKDPKTDRGSDS